MRRVCALALLVVGGLGIAGVGLAVGFAQRAQSEPRVLTASAAPIGEVTPVEPAPAPPPPAPRPEERPSRAAAVPRPAPTPPPAPRGPLASTVTIRSLTAGGPTSGTGIVLDAAGHILTNSHVLDGSRSVSVQVGGTGPAYAAAIVGRYVQDDIALLQVVNAPALQPAVLGRSSTVAVGQPVAVIGNAVGRGLAATSGRVTATGQTITGQASDGRTQVIDGLIELEAAVVKGDSGGPVLDGSGAVVGVLTAGGSVSSRGAPRGYAVPIDTAMAAARQIQSSSGGDAAPASAPQPSAPAPDSPPASTPGPSQGPPNVNVSQPPVRSLL